MFTVNEGALAAQKMVVINMIIYMGLEPERDLRFSWFE